MTIILYRYNDLLINPYTCSNTYLPFLFFFRRFCEEVQTLIIQSRG